MHHANRRRGAMVLLRAGVRDGRAMRCTVRVFPIRQQRWSMARRKLDARSLLVCTAASRLFGKNASSAASLHLSSRLW